MRPALWTVLLLPLFLGCVVLQSTYDKEVTRRKQLVERLELAEAQVEELAHRVAELERTGESLKLERSSLSEERVQLLNELEDLRLGNEGLRQQLDEEKSVRKRREAEIADISGTYRSLVEELEQELETGQVEIQRLRGQLQVRAVDRILFDSGSTQIKEEGRVVLSKVAAKLRDLSGYRIRVDGHTDDVPIATAHFPSNWELSAARAARVVRFLVEQGVDPAVLSATGFGEHQLLVPNDNPEHRARNRRIEIVLVPEKHD